MRVGSRAVDPPFDWDDPAGWEPAVRGIGSVYVSYYPDLAVPGGVETVGSFAEVAGAGRRPASGLAVWAWRGAGAAS